MSSTFLGIQIGKSGLNAAQINLNITGQNISNADTQGYTRQSVITSSAPPSGAGYVIRQVTQSSNVGQGVRVLSVDQLRSAYLDEQYRSQYSDFCSSEYRTQGLSYLEDLFDELDDNTSLTASISDFFDALSDFAGDTTSEAARTTVQQTARSMTDNFNMIYGEMVDLYNDQNTSVRTVAEQISSLASQIADLNATICDYERSGVTANDLRDQRNLLLDKLSGYSDFTCSEDAKGMVNVWIAGEALVDGKTAGSISITSAADEIDTLCQQLSILNGDVLSAGIITPDQETQRDGICSALQQISGKISCNVNADGTASVSIDYVSASMTQVTDSLVDGSTCGSVSEEAVKAFDGADMESVLKLGETYLNTDTVSGGELFAHLSLRGGDTSGDAGVPYYIGRLDDLARTVAETVNECMNKGYTYPDEENGFSSVTGTDVDLFADFGNQYALVTAGNFSVSDSVLSSVWNIAGSDSEIDLSSDSTQTSNNKVALLLADLINNTDYGDMLDGLISHLGQTVSGSQSLLDTRESLVESTENQRQSISGVSVDEEAVNLIMYQQTYNACSRVITTMDQMLDKLINGTGTVGL